MSDTEGGLSELLFEGGNLFTNLALLLFEFLALDFGFDGADDLEFLVASLLVGYVEASDFVVERIVDGEIFGFDGSITKGSKQDVGSLLIAVELANLVLVFGNGCTQLLLQFLDLVFELGTDNDVTGVVVHGEAAGKKDDAHILTKLVVVHSTPDNFDVAVEAIDKMVHLGDLGHGDGVLVAETEFEEQVLGIGDLVVLKQWGRLGSLDGLTEAVFAVGATGGDECHATVAEGGGDIGKVEVDVSALVDDVGDGLGGSGERIVGLAESVAEVEVGIDVDEAVVVDHEKGIAPFFDGLDTFERHEDLLLAFELERDCDNADGEDAVPVPPPIPAVMNTISVPSDKAWRMVSAYCSAKLRAISGLAPAPRPFSPMSSLLGMLEPSSACLSVLIMRKETSSIPVSYICSTALEPPPPTPTTLMMEWFSWVGLKSNSRAALLISF